MNFSLMLINNFLTAFIRKILYNAYKLKMQTQPPNNRYFVNIHGCPLFRGFMNKEKKEHAKTNTLAFD